MLALNLQKFAGEKTEKATPKRRQEARKEGNIPKSHDLSSAIGLVGAMIALRIFGGTIWSSWINIMQTDFMQITTKNLTQREVLGLFANEVWAVVQAVMPILLVTMGLGLAATFIQVGPVFLPNLLLPDFSRIQPISGFKRLFSPRTAMEGLKSIAKVSIIGILTYISIQTMAKKIAQFNEMDIHALPPLVGAMVFQLGIEIAVLMVVLAFVDFLFQRNQFEKSIRMSKQDIKDEFKQQEGDQQIKGKIRQRGRQMAFRRMMKKVPEADVVITNPSHFAIALKYDAEKMSAPVVIAKGQDLVALRIKQVAKDAGVPTVENRPLAQTLYREVDLDGLIPPDLFQAVAEVLAYVYSIKNMGQGVKQ